MSGVYAGGLTITGATTASLAYISVAPQNGRATADFYTDGIGDEVEIQAAINAASTTGGIVLLREGTYTFANPITTLASNLQIIGTGEATILKLGANANCKMFNSSIAYSNITFRNLQIDGNGTNQSNGAARDDRSLVYLSNVTHLKFINCFIQNCRHGAAIRLASCNQTFIQGCKFFTNGITGAAFVGDCVYIADSNYLRVVGNYFDTSTDTGVAMDGVQYSDIIGNNFINCQSQAIAVSCSSSNTSNYCTISGNTINGTGSSTPVGIYVYNFGNPGTVNDVTISGNVLNACDRSIIIDSSSRVIVTGNLIENNQGSNKHGVVMFSTTANVNDVLIHGNTFYSITGRGVDFEPTLTSTNIDIYNNKFITVGTPIGGTPPNTARIRNNAGYNPQGAASITVTASPFTYTAGATPETVYITAGTVSSIAKNSVTLFTATEKSIDLEPNESVVVTYSSAPTMNKDRH